MTEPHVVFFRGLSTYGHDHAQLSIVRLGPMFKHMRRELTARAVNFHPVLGMGVGPLDEVAARAAASVRALPIWSDPEVPVHFVGHSAGGLVARLTLEHLGDARLISGAPKIASILTIASPHRGSGLAQIFCDMPTNYPGTTRFFRALGYDIRPKLKTFRTMTAAHVAECLVDADVGRFPAVRTGSIVCAPPKKGYWSRIMRAFHLLPAFREFDQPSDGVIEKSSQYFGRQIFEVALDHFQQAGFFGGRREFRRMCDVVASFVRGEVDPNRGAADTAP